MNFDVVYGKQAHTIIVQNDFIKSVENYFNNTNDEGTLYLGFLLTADSEGLASADALLVGKRCGVVAFIFTQNFTQNSYNLESVYEEQDDLYFRLTHYFQGYPNLRIKRELAFSFRVVSVVPSVPMQEHNGYDIMRIEDIPCFLQQENPFKEDWYFKVCEALQKVESMKPKKKREHIENENSFGGKIKEIERQIANLDQWQRKAAMECPDGPQRIRGLAGSGKTIVLAWKAAYLHAQFPEWNIAITFYTRSLSQQIESLVRQYYIQYAHKEPNWEKLSIVHSWGNTSEEGLYAMAAHSLNLPLTNYFTAKNKYGRDKAFSGICEELLSYFDKNYTPIFDAVLIDEAQDMPASFFQLVYRLTKDPKRIIWAYDEMQNLNNITMPSLKEMFGFAEEKDFSLHNRSGEARRDIVLPVCYRNPMWTLTVAHALGFGIYRSPTSEEGIVQMFDSPSVWEDIGYIPVGGKLESGSHVVLERKKDATPEYFRSLLSDSMCIQYQKFSDITQQFAWVANEIEKNIKEDELDPDDILVIFPDALKAKEEYMAFRKFLWVKEIDSVLAGIDTSPDIFRKAGAVSCSSIYRAKGNEAPMVYIMNANYCAAGMNLIQKRNILFTAITRSRAWVRILGTGTEMDIIVDEISSCINNKYRLEFTLPTAEKLASIRRLNRDRSDDEVRLNEKANRSLEDIRVNLENGRLDAEMLTSLKSLFEEYYEKTTQANYNKKESGE